MDWNKIIARMKEHPFFVVLGFVAAIVFPFVGLFANLLSPGWAAVASIGFVLALFAVLVWPPNETAMADNAAQTRLDSPPQSVQGRQEDITERCNHVRKQIQRQFVAGYGDRGRLDYFYERVRGQDHNDSLYREAIESLKDDPQWAVVVAAVDEWIAIGFNTIVEWNANWKNSGTLNQLYIAAYNTLLRDDELRFEYGKGVDFAQAVGAIVASRRRAEH